MQFQQSSFLQLEYVPLDIILNCYDVEGYNHQERYEQYLCHKASQNRLLQLAYHSNPSAESHAVNGRYKAPISQAMSKKVNTLNKSELLPKKPGFNKYGTCYGEEIT